MKIDENSTEHLTKWLISENFSFDKESAIKYIQDNFAKGSFPYQKRKQIAENFNQELKGYSRDGKDDRLHSLFTRMPSDLKKFVRFKNERLVEIDIRNSQPLILIFLLNQIEQIYLEWRTTEDTIEKELPRQIRNKINQLINNTNDKYYNKERYKIDINKISNNISTILSNSSGGFEFNEIERFKQLVHSGELYDYLGNELMKRKSIWKEGNLYKTKLFNKDLSIQEIKEFKTIRECSKTITLNALYSPKGTKGIRAVNDFKKVFPALCTMLNALKGTINEDLPILLQRIEAKLVIDYCAKKINKKYPDIPLISRHDSLSTTEAYGNLLLFEIQELTTDYFGFNIELRRDPW